MRLVLVVDVYEPAFSTAAARMMKDLAEALVDAGHRVAVVTPLPGLAEQFSYAEEAGINVLRVRADRTKGQSKWRRGLAELLYTSWLRCAYVASPLCNFAPHAVVWYSPSIFLGPFAAWLKRRHGATGYLILRDIFPDWALESGTIRPGLAAAALRRFADFQYRAADVIGLQSPADKRYFPHSLFSAQLEFLPGWIKPEPDIEPIKPSSMFPEIEDQHVAIFGGSLGDAQDPENILRLAQRLKGTTPVKILVLARGQPAERLRGTAAGLELTNVLVRDCVDGRSFKALLRGARIGLVSLHRNFRVQNIPGRLTSYCEAALPTVASVNPGSDIIELLAESGAGIGLVNGDDDGFADAVRRLATDDGYHLKVALCAHKLSQRFSPSSAAAQILAAINKR